MRFDLDQLTEIAATAPPPAWAAAGLLLLAMAALVLVLRLTRRGPRANAAPSKSPSGDLRGSAALKRSGETARRRLGLMDAPPPG